jgi:hypothetical protein
MARFARVQWRVSSALNGASRRCPIVLLARAQWRSSSVPNGASLTRWIYVYRYRLSVPAAHSPLRPMVRSRPGSCECSGSWACARIEYFLSADHMDSAASSAVVRLCPALLLRDACLRLVRELLSDALAFAHLLYSPSARSTIIYNHTTSNLETAGSPALRVPGLLAHVPNVPISCMLLVMNDNMFASHMLRDKALQVAEA